MKVAIIGAGNMGGAMASGLLRAKAVEPHNLNVADLNAAALAPLKALGIKTFEHGAEAAQEADLVIIAVKPWLAQEVMRNISAALAPSAMVASVAAGITIEQMQEELGKRTIFRVMPNTAVLVGQSMTFVASSSASREQEKAVLSLFACMGKAFLVAEPQMAAATALSSCGIAYAMRYISANMRAGVELGFTPDMAKEVVLQTVHGAVSLLKQTGEHPEKEIDKVTTPNGLTIKGLNMLDHEGFSSAIINAVKASFKKKAKNFKKT
jgi:pyrroline-5-carboxylate reductase